MLSECEYYSNCFVYENNLCSHTNDINNICVIKKELDIIRHKLEEKPSLKESVEENGKDI